MSAGTRTQTVNLFDQDSRVVAVVDLTYDADGGMPNVVTYKGRTFACVLGQYREARAVADPPESKPTT